jgi:hypothetical protein
MKFEPWSTLKKFATPISFLRSRPLDLGYPLLPCDSALSPLILRNLPFDH